MGTNNRRRAIAFWTLAEEEFRLAQHIRTDFPRQSAYQLQQCVEKLVRAILEVENVPAGTTHNLRALGELVPATCVFAGRFAAFDDLSPAATRYRYPSSGGLLSTADPDDLSEWISRIRILKFEVETYLRDKFGEF
jgi:HEPN domain-containing protein